MRTKKTLTVLMMLLLMAGGSCLTSCNDTDDGSYVAPITQYEKVGGKWQLNTITQVDEATSKTMTLTDQFDFASFVINLNTDAKGNPSTFTVDGTAPALLPTSGSWKLANPFVNTDGSSATILLNDKVKLTVTAVPGAQPVLEFKLTRKQNGKAFLSYVYNLSPVSTGTDEAN